MPDRRALFVAGPILLALTLAAAACATSSGGTSSSGTAEVSAAPVTGQAGADSVIRVSVAHNSPSGGLATIYVEPSAGVRTGLGTIEPGTTKTFSYRVEAQNRQVRLIAINALGQTTESERITVPRGAGLSWDLQINALRIRR